MEVVSIEKVRRVYKVVFDEETVYITHSILTEWPLKPGMELNREQYDNFLLEKQYKPCLEYAVTLLGQRAYAEKELEARLQHAGYHPSTTEMVIYKLQKSHILNDQDYAQMYAQQRVESKVGQYRIARELRKKGVDADTIRETLAEVPEEEMLEGAISLVQRQLAHPRAGEDPRKTAQRITAMLVRRGFSFDVTKKALEQVRSDMTDGIEDW